MGVKDPQKCIYKTPTISGLISAHFGLLQQNPQGWILCKEKRFIYHRVQEAESPRLGAPSVGHLWEPLAKSKHGGWHRIVGACAGVMSGKEGD
jgi:hypothetical protein